MSSNQYTSPDGSEIDSTASYGKIEVAGTPQALTHDAKLITAKGNVITKEGVVISSQESDASLSTNIFADPEVRAYYVDVYEKAQYECRHVFDADLNWTPEEEKKIVRKLDWHVCLWACTMFFSLQIDRGNLGQAVSGTFLKDLKLNTNGI
jgi:hypothetical protein